MSPGELYALALALLFAVAAGLVGSFALSKRMLLASDVLSHLALPGLGLALLLHWNPLAGGAATLLLGTLLVWNLEQRTGLAADVAIGVVFAAALALGAVITPREDLLEALFGRFEPLSAASFAAGAIAVAAILVFLYRFRDALVLSLLSPELAASSGVNLGRLELYFLLIFSLTIMVGLRFMGALLASALVILPAATGRRFADSLSRFLVASSVASVLAVAAGFFASRRLFPRLGLGPAIVLVSALLFVASLAAGGRYRMES
ncbi:MAG TPA: metal ABC transporter permease [Candidatus Acidoferrales bacterium]|nr:metal ABC transporter permease [Candidatus Acidoferrales bacterium]